MNKKNNYIILTIIPIIVIVILLIIAISCANYFNSLKREVKEDVKLETQVSTLPTSSKEPTYINECNYKGELKQFPELYDVEFAKTDNYISNKEFSKEHSDIFEACESRATKFIEALLNVDYRLIANDTDSYVSNVMLYADYEAYHTDNYGTEDEITMPLYEYIYNLADYFVENTVQMEAKFYTDDSLVYNDFYNFVRGELVFTIYDCKNPIGIYEKGNEYKVPIDVALHRSPSYQDNRSVIAFGDATDKIFFLNP